MRRVDIIVVVFLLAGIAFSTLQDFREPQQRRPDTPAPTVQTLPTPDPALSRRAGDLPAAAREDPVYEIKVKPKTSDMSGSAVSIADGVWLTADHVTDSCQSVFVATDAGFIRARRVVAHGAADVAVMLTQRSGPALALSGRLARGQIGFHYGFPAGQPGEVLTTLMGRAKLRVHGARNRQEAAIVWAENRRHPASLDSLGGISGGPVLNDVGSVVGELSGAPSGVGLF